MLVKTAWHLSGRPDKLTLDLDGTLIDTNKREAEYCYLKTKAYQPMTVYCPELMMVVAHEFRDGNVSPAEGYQRLVERCQKILPGVHFTALSVFENSGLGHQKSKTGYFEILRKPSDLRDLSKGQTTTRTPAGLTTKSQKTGAKKETDEEVCLQSAKSIRNTVTPTLKGH